MWGFFCLTTCEVSKAGVQQDFDSLNIKFMKDLRSLKGQSAARLRQFKHKIHERLTKFSIAQSHRNFVSQINLRSLKCRCSARLRQFKRKT